MSTVNRDEFFAGFLAEADEHLRAATTSLLAIEDAVGKGTPHARPVRDLFRALHTLKGIASMVEVEPVVELAHEMEAILRAVDRGQRRLTPRAVDLLVRGLGAIETRVRAVASRKPVPAAPADLVAELAALEERKKDAPAPTAAPLAIDQELVARLAPAEQEHLAEGLSAGARAVRLDFVPSRERASEGITITSVRERLSKLGEIVKVIPRSVPISREAPGGLAFTLLLLTRSPESLLQETAAAVAATILPVEVAPAPHVAPTPAAEDEGEDAAPGGRSYVRVEVSRLDDALEKLSALVVTRFRLARAVGVVRERGSDLREIDAILTESGRQLRDLRAAIMRARMVTVAEMLERVPLIVRGLAQRTGKPVRLELDAGQAELDKAVGELLFPAIVHLVRNAVDHAIEPAAERRASGKPDEGHVRVGCFERSDNRLELAISDDGRGVDAARVAAKARHPVPATPAELLELICLPGLSTVESATSTSGRGMGMDIVRRTIERLGGELELETVPGKGTTFRLRVPLSISILDAITFECARQSFAVPVSMVDEIVEIEAKDVFRGPGPRREAASLLRRRERVMPLFELARVFALEPASGERGRKALVVKKGGEPFAFAVDRMLGQSEVVIRPLEDPLVKVQGVTGSTDLGDGRPVLVVDLLALTSRAGVSA